MYEKYINPIDYMKTTEPEAYDYMIGLGLGLSLDLETELMAARTFARGGRLHAIDMRPEKALIPEDICKEVMSMSCAITMRAEIEAITGRLAVH